MQEIFVVLLVLVVIFVILNGILKVFAKNFWLALMILILLTPLFFIWALIEGLFGD